MLRLGNVKVLKPMKPCAPPSKLGTPVILNIYYGTNCYYRLQYPEIEFKAGLPAIQYLVALCRCPLLIITFGKSQKPTP